VLGAGVATGCSGSSAGQSLSSGSGSSSAGQSDSSGSGVTEVGGTAEVFEGTALEAASTFALDTGAATGVALARAALEEAGATAAEDEPAGAADETGAAAAEEAGLEPLTGDGESEIVPKVRS